MSRVAIIIGITMELASNSGGRSNACVSNRRGEEES